MNFSFDATAESVPPVLREELARHLKRFGEKNGGVKHIRFVKLQGNGGTGEEKGASWPSEEAFRIESSPEEVTVSSAGERGLLYGGQTLLQKMESSFECGVLEESPLCPVRGVKLFLPSPDAEGMAHFKGLVDLMSRFRYNFLLLETGGAMEYRRHPEINEGWIEYCKVMNEYSGKAREITDAYPWCKNSIHSTNGGGRVVSRGQIQELLDYCRERCIEVVPELPSLSHCDYLLTRHPELSERAEDPWPDTACPNHPDYYPLLFDLIDETLELFRPSRMHLGHDEYCTMGVCPRCRNIPPPQIYADDIRRCRDYLHSRNVKMMIWGEKLLPARFSDGTPIGGSAQKVWHHPDSPHTVPATWPAIDLIPQDIEIMHWYWSIDRALENEFTARQMPMVFGNFDGAGIPDWKTRSKAPNFLGSCCSNWGTTDPITLQRNGILFEIAFTHALHWKAELSPDTDYPAMRDEALRRLYQDKAVSEGPGRFLEIIHSTTEKRPSEYYVDGIFVDEKKDLLGHHVFRSENGSELRFPVIYGSNITSADCSLERGENRFRTSEAAHVPLSDRYDLDRGFIEISYSSLPETRDGKTVCRCRFRLPDSSGKTYSYAGFEPVDSFSGEVSLLEFSILTQR